MKKKKKKQTKEKISPHPHPDNTETHTADPEYKGRNGAGRKRYISTGQRPC